MPWDELRRVQQRARRSERALARGNAIGERHCEVCFDRLHWGERHTKRLCSDRCRQVAFRLRRDGLWPRQMKLHALHERCWQRIGRAISFENERELFNILLAAVNPIGGWRPGMAERAAAPMLAAEKERKRQEATTRTLDLVRRARRRLQAAGPPCPGP
jgi:hypothetical protein